MCAWEESAESRLVCLLLRSFSNHRRFSTGDLPLLVRPPEQKLRASRRVCLRCCHLVNEASPRVLQFCVIPWYFIRAQNKSVLSMRMGLTFGFHTGIRHLCPQRMLERDPHTDASKSPKASVGVHAPQKKVTSFERGRALPPPCTYAHPEFSTQRGEHNELRACRSNRHSFNSRSTTDICAVSPQQFQDTLTATSTRQARRVYHQEVQSASAGQGAELGPHTYTSIVPWTQMQAMSPTLSRL